MIDIPMAQSVVHSKEKTGVYRGKASYTWHKMLMHSAPEGCNTIFSDVPNYIIWQAVPNMYCCVDESPTSRDSSGDRYCKSMARHWKAGRGNSPGSIRLKKQSTKVCWAYAGVHFVEDCCWCHLTSLVERSDVEFWSSFILVHTNNSKCLLLNRVQQSKCCWASTHPIVNRHLGLTLLKPSPLFTRFIKIDGSRFTISSPLFQIIG